MRTSFFAAAAVAIFGIMGSAQAATLGGTFKVTAVNVTNVTGTQSQATKVAFDAAKGFAGAMQDIFTYTGLLDFSTLDGNATTISEWLGTGVGGSVDDLDGGFGMLQQSKSSITDGSATTTFYLFERLANLGATNFSVTHDDGIAVYDDGMFRGGLVGPTTKKITPVKGFDGGKFSILYVATNNNPSILKVDFAPVPLPAAFPLLVAGLAGLGLMRLRRKAA